MPIDTRKAEALSKEVARISGYGKPFKPVQKVQNQPMASEKPKPRPYLVPPALPAGFKVHEPETAETIANKLNATEGTIEAKVIKDLPKLEDTVGAVVKELKTGKTRLDAKDILNMPGKGPLDQRWHGGGGGLSVVTHDATLTGNGTVSSPLSVVPSGSTGYQQPTSGVVDGVNTAFDWATAPNVIVVDQGRTMQAISSDGTVNWTGTTTTTFTIAPNFDVFAVA